MTTDTPQAGPDGPRSVAVMQPYVFPYLGYFHLIEASDVFVCFDDVSYRPRTWMNRNRLLLDGQPHTFTVPVRGGSQNTPIMDVELAVDERWRRKFRATLAQAYAGAPQYEPVSSLVESVITAPVTGLTELALLSLESVLGYLGRPFAATRSSVCSPASVGLGRVERLVHLTRELGGQQYLNLSGGRALYGPDDFRPAGLRLGFVASHPVVYDQGLGGEFVPDLSILDVLMFNDVDAVRAALTAFDIED